MARTFSILVGLVLLAVVGCQSQTATTTVPSKKPTTPLAPRDIVDNTIAAYRAAVSYSDHGRVRLSYHQDGERLEDSAPLAVQFARPNRLRVDAYQVVVASDGQQLHARVRDEATADLDGQVVERPAPQKFSLDDLYADEVLRDALQSGLGRHPVQLELLFGDAPLLDLIKPEASLKLLESSEVDGHPCYRLEAKLVDGNYVFAIDRKSFLLRQIEYPAAAMLPELARSPGISKLKLVAEFRQATFDQQLPEATFAFELPDSAQKVRYFVLPPQGLPTQHFGRQPGEYAFATAAGESVTNADLSGKITALLWFTQDSESAWALKQFQDALHESSVTGQVASYVVAAEEGSTRGDQLAATLQDWQVSVPLLRDERFAGRDVFGIRQSPTLVILDAAGRVQIFEEGVSTRLTQTLPVVLERLAAGDDLATEILADARKAEQQYAKNLAAAADVTAATAVVELTPAEPVEAFEPEHFVRTALWTLPRETISEPGNFCIVTTDDGPRIYVLDGHRKVVELDAMGKILRTHMLDLSEDVGVTYLRTAVDREGRRWFVGSALLGKQLIVFNDQWQ